MKRILVIQTAFLGDVVLATSIMEKLHARFPDARIDAVVRKGNEGLFNDHPFLHRLFVWNKQEHRTRNLTKLIGELRKTRYDHIINCQRFFSTGLITVLARGGEKVGYDKNPLSLFFARKVKHVMPDPAEVRKTKEPALHAQVHEVDRLNALIQHLTDHERPLPKLHPTGTDRARVARTRPYVCIAPGSVWFTKQWPEEKWVELIKRLPSEHDVLLIGGPTDAAACERIVQGAGRGEVMAGRSSLLETAALVEHAHMNYVNDSAPLHVASAMNAPVTAVFCSTVPEFGFGPLNANGRVAAVPVPLTCRPCGIHGYKACPLGHFKCALEIPVSSVLQGT